jgi:hypothetical protein
MGNLMDHWNEVDEVSSDAHCSKVKSCFVIKSGAPAGSTSRALAAWVEFWGCGIGT